MRQSPKYFLVIRIMTILLVLLTQYNFTGNAQTSQPDKTQIEHFTYIPLVHKALLLNTDLSISNIEVTQTTQGLSNHVQLIAERPTTVRVYARVNETNPLSDVQVSLYGTRSGAPLPGSPLLSVAQYAYPLTTDINTLRLDNQKSFNFSLPAEWLSGQVELRAIVDSTNQYPEKEETNNTLTITADFLSIPALTVKIVPIKYTPSYEDITYSLSTSTKEQNRQDIQEALMKIFPTGTANVVMRSTDLVFTGDLYYDEEWDRLLDKIAITKYSDGSPPSEVYYGLIPILDEYGNSWWYGGVVGYGYVGPPTYSGPRAAIGLASGYIEQFNSSIDGEVTAAHEIGHNLGRLHAPCGNPESIDPSYPYAGGKIGQFGFSPSNNQIFSPYNYYDIMGYCQDVWISDYNYTAMMQSQLLYGSSLNTLQTQDSLQINANIDSSGELSVQPAYVTSASPLNNAKDGEYSAEFLDADGNVTTRYTLPVTLALAENFSSRKISAALPMPKSTPAGLRILKDGNILFEKAFIHQNTLNLPDQQKPEISTQISENTLSISWNLKDTPTMLRYSSDGGKTWTTLEADNITGQWHGSVQAFMNRRIIFQIIPAWSLDTITLDQFFSDTQ